MKKIFIITILASASLLCACRQSAPIRSVPPTEQIALAPDHSTQPVAPTPPAPSPERENALTSADGTYHVVVQTTPSPIPMNQFFELDVRVFDSAWSPLANNRITLHVDGAMPAHGHGMNTQPLIVPIHNDRFGVSGMLFHMPGTWALYFDITRNGITERAQQTVVLE